MVHFFLADITHFLFLLAARSRYFDVLPCFDPDYICYASGLYDITTLFLIFAGALVKSHEVGLSVPDWPTTYGYNMFTFPIQDMVGGIFYEHSHRLIASFVGLLSIILAVWMGIVEKRIWVKKIGYFALGLVILQGLFGG